MIPLHSRDEKENPSMDADQYTISRILVAIGRHTIVNHGFHHRYLIKCIFLTISGSMLYVCVCLQLVLFESVGLNVSNIVLELAKIDLLLKPMEKGPRS